jgi:hypothetical protein
MAITQGKMPFVFGMVVLATLLIAAPAAHAACRSPKNICRHFDDCLQRTSDPNNKDADGIRAGVKARNGQIVLAGAEACARDLGRKQQWDKWARGCSELEVVQIAKVGLELGSPLRPVLAIASLDHGAARGGRRDSCSHLQFEIRIRD